MTEDRTFQPLSAYGSQRWCAVRLGMPYDTFRRQRPNMEKHMGFPPSDPLNGCTIKADVDAWIAKRRRIADTPQTEEQTPHGGINHDAA